ncbi:hypothetical protein E2C01_034604 [Portunus trituberculatus]|uniref:Uncharacterized protein n=1 Tax=Portunus trituberculatus TaxID=210409 RepID=A0A5B7F612_PORTR|nr:hypothetical protein [Portunus trituberculatus]
MRRRVPPTSDESRQIMPCLGHDAPPAGGGARVKQPASRRRRVSHHVSACAPAAVAVQTPALSNTPALWPREGSTLAGNPYCHFRRSRTRPSVQCSPSVSVALEVASYPAGACVRRRLKEPRCAAAKLSGFGNKQAMNSQPHSGQCVQSAKTERGQWQPNVQLIGYTEGRPAQNPRREYYLLQTLTRYPWLPGNC